jgi:A/G-specific adenine glycosylase
MAKSTEKTQALKPISHPQAATFATTLLAWQAIHGRHDLPWQVKEPYHVWISEIMLQQTQVQTVMAYYEPFLLAFPTVADLAAASQEEVYAKWSGLGYYRRARFLHEGAKKVMNDYGGAFPTAVDSLLTLPGVGQSTAHAIASFCANARVSILDGNVQRSLSRWVGFETPVDSTQGHKQLMSFAQTLVPPSQEMPAYTQALMDFGALLCTPKKPSCGICPLQGSCEAFKQNKVAFIPVKKPKKSIPTRFYQCAWLEQDGKIGFIQYQKELGVWEHLFGPPISQVSELPAGDVLFHVKHTFSHFHGQFYVFQGTPQKSLIFKTKQEWLASGIPTPIRAMLEGL